MLNQLQTIENADLQDFLSKCKQCRTITHNNAISAMVYEVLADNNDTYILKILYNNLRFKREIFCLQTVKNFLPVADIVRAFAPTGDFPGAILMTKIPGEPLQEEGLTVELAFSMGVYLAKLHEIKIDSYHDFAVPNKKIDSPLAILIAYFQESLDECKTVVRPELLRQCEQVFQTLQPAVNDFEGPNIIHRDYKPGNVLANDKQSITGIIDFENAKASFTQDDFAQMETLVWHNQPTLKPPFLQGYKSIRNLPKLDFLPLLKMCKLLGAVGFTVARGTWHNKHAYIYGRNIEILTRLSRSF